MNSISDCHNTHQAISAIEFEAEGIRAVADIQRRSLLPRFFAAHPIGVTDAMMAGHKGGGDFVRICDRCRDGASTFSTAFTVILMIFNQFIRQFCHQIPFHLANNRGGDETRFIEFQFQIDGIENRVAPLHGLLPDVFGGLVGVVGGDFVALDAG